MNTITDSQTVRSGISRNELYELYQRPAWKSILQTIVIISTYFLLSCIGFWFKHWEIWMAVWLFQGFILSGFLGAAHDCAHGTLYVSPRVNRIAGALWSSSVLFNFSLYKYFHLVHHRYTSVEGDTEPWGTFPNIWVYVLTLPTHAFFIAFWKMSWMATKGYYPDFVKSPTGRKAVNQDNWVLFGWLILAFILTLISPWTILALYWMPMIIYFPMVFLTSHPEHYNCDWGSNQWNNTRTITSNPIFRYYFWNGNYHAEHHIYPGVPSCNYHKIHKLIKHRFKYVENSYIMFHLRLIWDLIFTNQSVEKNSEIRPNHRVDFTYIMVSKKDDSLSVIEDSKT
jgi:fatty acid desaturase